MLIHSCWETFVSELVSKPGYSSIPAKTHRIEKMRFLLLVLKIKSMAGFHHHFHVLPCVSVFAQHWYFWIVSQELAISSANQKY